MRLFLTGGCGFLGSNLARAGTLRGFEVTVFDNLSRAGSAANLAWLREQGAVRHVHADIRDSSAVARAVRDSRPDAVFHVAGQVAMTTSLADPRLDFEINSLGTLNLLEAIRAHAPAATVLYSSTNKVYGDLQQFRYGETATRWECLDRPHGFAEDTQLAFHSPYGCSKGCADQYMLDYARLFGLNTVVFRHSSMYGGRQFATYDQGWIGWFCQKAVETARGALAQDFTVSGDGKQVRDVLHADDMVSLYFAACERIAQARGMVFNIGGGMANSLSLLELFAKLEHRLATRLVWRHLPPRESDQRVFVADIRAAERVLGWKPTVGVDQGLDRMLDWVGGR
jgi:CDP-paratose 2-epimerase